MMDKAVKEVKRKRGKRALSRGQGSGFSGLLALKKWRPIERLVLLECATCPQYQKTCHPEIMRLEIK